ncbi:hypothetical protein MKQ70_17960 [Chitinophaga sedimenti]|uniref:hypothetical protein n=1 Tax=Chitinophaga sedimenti TaxID=2033606 RepID=UPI0020050E6E|nr:hypothetical protein [Chitinophaga sedimenti]MCK7556800.1 hypothetical protein [Chitinophaga sedimenti]
MRLFILSIAAAAVFMTGCYKVREDSPVIVPGDTTSTEMTYKMKSRQVLEDIYKYYGVNGSVYVKESYPTQPGDPRYAYLWPYSAMFTGATLLKQMGYTDDAVQGYYNSTLAGMEGYKDVSRTPAAYQSSPVTEGLADRFYDDNAITGIDMLEAFHLTGDQQLLTNAKLCYTFCASGESPEAGGGLYWNEGC